MVRSYILTNKERRILVKYIELGLKLNNFSTLVYRLRKCKKKVSKDKELIDSVLKKLDYEKSSTKTK